MMHRSAQTPAPPRDFGELRSGAGSNAEGQALALDFSSLDEYERESRSKWLGCRQWAESNPEFMRRFEALALDYAAKGRHFSMRLVWERARYEFCASNGKNLFRMPNDYLPILSRWVCERHPRVAELTSRRRSRFDD